MRTAPSPVRGEQEQAFSPYLLWIIWLFWLFFLWQPISMMLSAPPSPLLTISIGIMALFVALYLWVTWHEAFRLTRSTPQRVERSWRSWAPIGVMLALAIMLTLLHGQDALGSLIYVSAALCGRLSAWRAALAALGLTLLAAVLIPLSGSSFSANGQILFTIPAVGSFVYFFGQAIRTNQQLRLARQEIARLAVSEERLRFARDLHDLLGHTLSLITLKSELARRLVSVSPEQAASEIADIETAARQALVEVREAVAGYRQATLEDELTAAQELLAAAGIVFTQRGEAPTLAPSVEATLSWALREGVTNVIRHSRARTCEIMLTTDGGRMRMEVRDDGAAGASTGADGNGLTGLRERCAALGGECAAGAAPDGGWRLVVSLPMAGDPRAADVPPTNERTEAPWSV